MSDPAEKLSVTLPAEMARMVRDKVRTGAYSSPSDVIREALGLLQDQEADLEGRLDELRTRIDEAIADPRPPISDEELGQRLHALHEPTVRGRNDAA